MRFEPLGQKMFTRRNWLLRCSILINVAVLLYIGSHVMIGDGNSFGSVGQSMFIQEQIREQQGNVREPLSKNEPLVVSSTSDYKAADSQNGVLSYMNVAQPNNRNDNSDDSPEVVPGVPPAAVGSSHSNSVNGGEIKADNNNNINKNNTNNNNNNINNKNNNKNNNSNNNVGDQSVIGNIVGDNFVNNTDGFIVTGDEKDFEERLISILKCYDRPYVPETLQRGDFWVLKNYVRADHGELKCHTSITYTTHADYTFLDNLIPLLERWSAPVSIALHAPGTDFQPTLDSIRYLRECLPESKLVREFATFHIYFSTKHIPKQIPRNDEALKIGYNCTLPPPYTNVTSGHLYKTQKKLLYPVNVGRNIARDGALTHFILASDIELYPNPGLVKKFLEMIARNEPYLRRPAPRVFPLSIFEVQSNSIVPRDKTELQELLRTKKAIPFHKQVCANCHAVPKSKEWMSANETEDLSVFHIGKRTGSFMHWEPIYIGTHSDPHYDERLSWEGKSDKMTQGYTLCVLDYEFHILDNAFLVHKPGIKVLHIDRRRAMLSGKTNQLIRKIIYPELKIMYGTRKGCAV